MCLRLHREDAEAHFLEQAFVRERADPTEVLEPRSDRLGLRLVLRTKERNVAVSGHVRENAPRHKPVRGGLISGVRLPISEETDEQPHAETGRALRQVL